MGAELRNDRGTPPRLARVSTDYNEQWMLAKYGLSESSPSATRFRRAGRGHVEVITFKPLSKNPGALHDRATPARRAEQVARTVQPFLGALPRHVVVFAQEGGQAQGLEMGVQQQGRLAITQLPPPSSVR